MKNVSLIVFMFFSFSVFAMCDLCQKAEKEIKAWDKANSKDTKQKASKDSHALLQRLALGIHSGDLNLISPTVRLLGAIYAKDFDPLHEELENLTPDLAQPEFHKAFDSEVEKLPADQKEKLMVGLEVVKGGHEADDELSVE